jgi:hypothetical protein
MAEDEANEATGGMHIQHRTARQRKSTNQEGFVNDDAEFEKMIKAGNKGWMNLKKGKTQKLEQAKVKEEEARECERVREAEAKAVALREKGELKANKGKGKKLAHTPHTHMQRVQEEVEERHIAKGKARKVGSNVSYRRF